MVLVQCGIYVGVEDVWTQLCCLLFHVAARVEHLLHVRGTPDGEASCSERVETFILPITAFSLHRGKLQATCTDERLLL